jgi:hypothetical protein
MLARLVASMCRVPHHCNMLAPPLNTPACLCLFCRGHASENPELPEALKAKGIRFLGPPADAMAALGDKVRAACASGPDCSGSGSQQCHQ